MPAALYRAIEPLCLLICTFTEEEEEQEEEEEEQPGEEEEQEDNYNVPAPKKAKLSGNQNN